MTCCGRCNNCECDDDKKMEEDVESSSSEDRKFPESDEKKTR